MVDQERLSNRAHEARVALRMARLRRAHGDQAHYAVPPTPFLLGMTNTARHEAGVGKALLQGIKEKASP